MPRTNQNYQSKTEETVYDVTTQITELSLPRVGGYQTAEVAFGGAASASYNLGEVSVVTNGPFIPISGSTPLLEVVSQVQGASDGPSTQYLFYTTSNNTYFFFTSPNADGSEATGIGSLPTTTTDPTNTTLKAVYSQPSTKPVIVIGSIVIDPPITD